MTQSNSRGASTGHATQRRVKETRAYDHVSKKRLSIPTEQTERDIDIGGREHYAPPVRASEPRLHWDRQRESPGRQRGYALHIREKFSPQDMITKLGKNAIQTKIFESFNGFEHGAKYRYYNHRSKGNWQNRMIRGDSARVMATLLAHENYKGCVQTIIFDPPYGISFDSNFAPAMPGTNKSKKVSSANKLTKDPATCEAYCDMWERGLDSYLDAIYHRLSLMRDLLAEEGSIFVQIGPENVHRMALLLDEVFGHKNAVTTIMFKKSGGTASRFMPQGSDFLLWYAKNIDCTTYNPLYKHLTKKEMIKHMSTYIMLETSNGTSRKLTSEENEHPETIPRDCKLFTRVELTSQDPSETRSYDYVWNKKTYKCPPNRHWSISKEGMDRLNKQNRLVSQPSRTGHDRLRWKRYEDEVPGKRINNQWTTTTSPQTLRYAVQTSDEVIQRCILMTSNPGDLVLDPTGGSGVTAVIAERYGRRWVLIDSSPVSVATMRHCISLQTYDWYLLQDSKEGADEELKQGGTPLIPSGKQYTNDPAHGFVYPRHPYVSPSVLAGIEPSRPILIVDDPYKLRGVKRVTGPFTVESESTSYALSITDPHAHAKFASRIVKILEQNGIDLVLDNKHLSITNIEAVPADLPYTHVGIINGKDAAIMLAPEFRAADNRLIHEASTHASKSGISELVVAAFEFQPLDVIVPNNINLTKILINRALQQPEINSSKLNRSFVMVAEPKIDIRPTKNKKWTVKIIGYVTYDPLTGNIVSGNSDDVDCWMIDTEYDEESFYAREVHFPNTRPKWASKQLSTIETMLGQDIDRDRWDAFTSLESSPFSSTSGKIAVKIITTTGDEMMKVFDLDGRHTQTRRR